VGSKQQKRSGHPKGLSDYQREGSGHSGGLNEHQRNGSGHSRGLKEDQRSGSGRSRGISEPQRNGSAGSLRAESAGQRNDNTYNAVTSWRRIEPKFEPRYSCFKPSAVHGVITNN